MSNTNKNWASADRNKIQVQRSDGRRDTYWGGQGNPLGKGHGHKVHAPGGFPIYSRQPGAKKQTQKSSYNLMYSLYGVKPPKRSR